MAVGASAALIVTVSPSTLVVAPLRSMSTKGTWVEVVAVVSAMGDTTDDLIELAAKINPKPNPREMDVLLSTGEIVSSTLLSMALEAEGLNAISLTGAQAGIRTDQVYGRARIAEIETERLERELKALLAA